MLIDTQCGVTKRSSGGSSMVSVAKPRAAGLEELLSPHTLSAVTQ